MSFFIDFIAQKLDILVLGLVPAYLRIGGCEADKIYYDLVDSGRNPKSKKTPQGYHQIMTRQQWKHLNAFIQRMSISGPLVA